MCKKGDIIGVQNPISEDGRMIGFHYYVVISDEKGKIRGFEFDKVASIMSSFHSEDQMRIKLKCRENILVRTNNFNLRKRTQKDGYIKADQLHYFDKKKTKYYEIGRVDIELFNELVERIKELDSKGKLKQNLNNVMDTNKIINN